MKSLNVDLPDKVAEELSHLVKSGWFQSEAEVVRMALLEFLSSRRTGLEEKFQREDIDWALQQKDPTGR
ncbi:MAG: ribbon-helix-helix domain-containing protein [Terriglobia bacterium]